MPASLPPRAPFPVGDALPAPACLDAAEGCDGGGAESARSAHREALHPRWAAPLDGLLVLAEMLLDTPLDEAQQRYAESILCAAEQLQAALPYALDAPRTHAETAAPIRQPFALHDTLRAAARRMAPYARLQSVALTVDIAADVPPRVVGDPYRLRQVLIVLLTHALRETENGALHLALRRHNRPEGGLAAGFEIKGLVATAEESEDRPGLASAEAALRCMGGALETGEPDRIRFTLPFEHAEESASPPTSYEEEIRRALSGLHVLLLSADDARRAELGSLLTDHGILVDEVRTGVAAIARLTAAPGGAGIDALFVDAYVPVTDASFLMRAPQAVRLPRPPIVLLDERRGPAEPAVDGVHPLDTPCLPEDIFALLAEVTGRPLPASAPPSPRVLLAEADPLSRDVTRQRLEHLGARVDVCVTGDEAFQAVQSRPYTLALLDLRLPDAERTIRAVRALDGAPGALPLIGLAPYSEPIEHLRAAGLSEVVLRPLRPNALSQTLERWSRLPSSPGEASREASTDPAAGGIVASLNELEAMMGEDETAALAEACFASARLNIEEILDGCERGDGEAVHTAAHAIKGSCLLGRVEEVKEACLRIEALAQTETLSRAAENAAELERFVSRLHQESEAYLQARASFSPPSAS